MCFSMIAAPTRQPPLPVGPHGYHPGLVQYPQMARDAGLPDADLLDDLPDRSFPLSQGVKDFQPGRIGEQLQKGKCIVHSVYT